VSSSYPTKTGMDRQTKRMNTGMCRTEGFINVPQRTPISRLKLQFPDLNEEVSIVIFINYPQKFVIRRSPTTSSSILNFRVLASDFYKISVRFSYTVG
jgi:hypothetical protein